MAKLDQVVADLTRRVRELEAYQIPAAFADFRRRLTALESRRAGKGPAGPPGTDGADGAGELHAAVVDGAVAGDITVPTLAADATLLFVIAFLGAGVVVTNTLDLTAEFAVTGANTINNAGGTSSAGGKLFVWWTTTT